MLFPRKPRGLGPSRADPDRWDGRISGSHCNPAPSRPRVLRWGGMQSAEGLWKGEPTKAQAAGDSTSIGYGSSVADTRPIPGSQRRQWFCTSGPIPGPPRGTKSDRRPVQKFGSFCDVFEGSLEKPNPP